MVLSYFTKEAVSQIIEGDWPKVIHLPKKEVLFGALLKDAQRDEMFEIEQSDAN